ncbi:MAG: proteasome subunit beta [Desulfurococcaceae archaeon]
MKYETKTTTVGLIARDHVILAADKRATAGTMVYHKQVKKISRLTNHAALTISGLVADAQFLVENARYYSRRYEVVLGKPIGLRALANYLSLLLSAYLRYYPFLVQLILGGYDSEGPHLYYLDLYGTVSKEKYTATGSGSPVAYGVLESEYKESLPVDVAVELAVKAVKAAIMRDGFTGEGVDVVVIGRDGVLLEKTVLLKKTLEKT